MRSLLVFLTLFGAMAEAASAPIQCQALVQDRSTQPPRTKRAPLKKASFDEQYLRVEISHYSFGSDLFYLPTGIGMIIHNDQSGRYVRTTAGFRRMGEAKIEEAVLSFEDHGEAGATFLQLSCFRPISEKN